MPHADTPWDPLGLWGLLHDNIFGDEVQPVEVPMQRAAARARAAAALARAGAGAGGPLHADEQPDTTGQRLSIDPCGQVDSTCQSDSILPNTISLPAREFKDTPARSHAVGQWEPLSAHNKTCNHVAMCGCICLEFLLKLMCVR